MTSRDEVGKQHFKDMLTAKKREILADIKKSMGDNMEDDVRLVFEVLQDNADKSVDEMLKHINAKIVGLKSEMLDDLDEALKKLEEGTYGICEECGCQIPEGRLAVMPCASSCVACQQGLDKKKQKPGAWAEGSEHLEDPYDYMPDE